jgi:hypothetical protein
MQNYSTTESANDAEFPQAGVTLDGGATVGPSEPTASTGAVPIAAGGIDEQSIDPGAVAPATTSNTPAPAAASTDSVSSHAQGSAAKQVFKYLCIEEPVRSSKNNLTSWKPPFEVEEGSEASLKEIIQRADSVRAPLQATPVPTGSAPYGSTDKLFMGIHEAIAGQASLPEQTSILLSYWAFSTWFSDALAVAPGLAIIAPDFEGDLVLRTLKNFCRYPMMLTRADISSLRKLNWHTTPTLLFYDPNISKQMVATLGCTSTRGYMINAGSGYQDFFGAKAYFLGEELSVDRIPRCSLQVRLQAAAPAPATHHSLRLAEAVVQDLRNQLQRYRTKNLVRVYNADFDAPLLTSETRAIANALGACIVDSPSLQSKLVSLLGPVESQRQADRSNCIEAATLEATLNLCHQGKSKILVGEIANEVNRIANARGERLRYSAEVVGHQLKKVGLSTRRLGKAGKGLAMDLATIAQLHELAAMYGGVGLELDEINLHCPLCAEKQ